MKKGAHQFKSQLLQHGPLSVSRTGANSLAEAFSHTEVHFAITDVPASVIAQQVISLNGVPVTVETWKTAREQLNPTAVVAQGKGTIGISTICQQSTKETYVNFITANPQLFGCPVSLITRPNRTHYRGTSRTGPLRYTFRTSADSSGFGAETIFGIPNDEDTYNIIIEMITQLDWLTNMPLVMQSPMKQGVPSGPPEPPHTEHVLSILIALWYLDLFETPDAKMMKDYHLFITDWFFDENGWKNPRQGAPTSGDFLTYLSGQYNISEQTFEQIWPNTGITTIAAAWTKINDFIHEYLYANPDSNYEKNDDSLIAVGVSGEVVFNERMAQDLAKRIWKNRISIPGGLIDVIFGGVAEQFKTSRAKEQWTYNIIESWRQRLEATCEYINQKPSMIYPALHSFTSTCTYISRLPATIKEVMIGHRGIKVPDELTLTQQRTYLVPTLAMTIMVMQGVSQLIADFIRGPNGAFSISYDDFIVFCGFESLSVEQILSLDTTLQANRRSSRIIEGNESAITKYQTITYYILEHLRSQYFNNFLEIAFTEAYYKGFVKPGDVYHYLSQEGQESLHDLYVRNETRRNEIISEVVSALQVEFCNYFIERAEELNTGRFVNFSRDLAAKLTGLREGKRVNPHYASYVKSFHESQEEGQQVSDARTYFDLYSRLYKYDEITCLTFFGEGFDEQVKNLAKNIGGFNYGANFIRVNQFDNTARGAIVLPTEEHLPGAIRGLTNMTNIQPDVVASLARGFYLPNSEDELDEDAIRDLGFIDEDLGYLNTEYDDEGDDQMDMGGKKRKTRKNIKKLNKKTRNTKKTKRNKSIKKQRKNKKRHTIHKKK